jgi:alkylation response protein AidB-like acyl-CoA dehydrogenase
LSGILGNVGYGGFCVSEEMGGLALDVHDAAVAFEELGRADAALAGYLTIQNMVSCIIEM